MDEGVHVRRIEIVFLVPSGGRQHDVAIQASGAHAEVEHSQQVELAFGGLFAIPHLRRDRKSVVYGKSVSVRVDLGGRRIIKQKKHFTADKKHQGIYNDDTSQV